MRFQCTFCFTIIRHQGGDDRISCPNCSKHVAVPRDRFETGCVIDDFVIDTVVGYGGMATVYLAKQLSMDRPVALKILSDEYVRRDNFRMSFLKEAKAAARLNHPNLIQAMKVGEDEGVYFYAMEYIQGQTVADKIDAEKNLEIDGALNIAQQCAEALHAAWTQEGLIHRDIKPDNIMLAEDGYAKVMDLGIAIRADEADKVDVSGTPTYMAPEQFRRERLDCRTDLYALGASLYHMLVGFPPYGGESVQDIARSHIFQPLQFPESNLVYLPQRIKRLISKMMAKDPTERYQDYEELLGDIVAIRKRLAPDEDQVPSVHTISFSKYRLHEKMADSPSEIYRRRSDKKRKVAIAKEQRTRRKPQSRRMGPWIVVGILIWVIVVLSVGVAIMQRQRAPSPFVKQARAYLAMQKDVQYDGAEISAIEAEIVALEKILVQSPEDPSDKDRAVREDLLDLRELLLDHRFTARQSRLDHERDQFGRDFDAYRDKLTALEATQQQLQADRQAFEDKVKNFQQDNSATGAELGKMRVELAELRKGQKELLALRQQLADVQAKATRELQYGYEWRLINYCRTYRFDEAEELLTEIAADKESLKDWAAERKKQLNNARRLYRAVYDSGTDLKGEETTRGRIVSINRAVARIAVTEGDIVAIVEMGLLKLDPRDILKLSEKRLEGEQPFDKVAHDFSLCTGEFGQITKLKLAPKVSEVFRAHTLSCFRYITDSTLTHTRAGNRKLAASIYKHLKSRYGEMKEFRPYEAELAEVLKPND